MRKSIWAILVIAVIVGVFYIARPSGENLEDRVTNRAEQQVQAEPVDESTKEETPVDSKEETAFKLAVPDFTTKTVRGETISLSDLAQDKPTIVGFWASWCHNCQRNLPAQQSLYEKYQDQINLIEVNLGEKRSAVDNYVNNNEFTFDLAYDEDSAIGRQWGIQYTNTHFLIGSNGQLVEGFPGDLTEEKIQKLLKS